MPISFFRSKRQSDARKAANAAFTLPRHALIALGLGFAFVVSAFVTLNPADTVLASPEEGAASYWLNERKRNAPSADGVGRQARQRQVQQQRAQQRSVQQQQQQAQSLQQQREAQMQAQYRYQQQVQAQMQQAPRRSGLSQIIDRMPWSRVVTITPGAFDLTPSIQQPEISSNRTPAVRRTANSSAAPKARPRALCVRLCDGSYFPAPGTGGGTQEDCNLACPRAPTRLYKTTNGEISTAISAATGASYFALPVAMRFSKTLDQTCSCGTSDPMTTILRDATLHRGDRVMTPEGFRVFKGGAKPPYSPRHFNSIDKALNLPRSERAILRSMERATGVRPGAARRDAFAASQPNIQIARTISR